MAIRERGSRGFLRGAGDFLHQDVVPQEAIAEINATRAERDKLRTQVERLSDALEKTTGVWKKRAASRRRRSEQLQMEVDRLREEVKHTWRKLYDAVAERNRLGEELEETKRDLGSEAATVKHHREVCVPRRLRGE